MSPALTEPTKRSLRAAATHQTVDRKLTHHRLLNQSLRASLQVLPTLPDLSAQRLLRILDQLICMVQMPVAILLSRNG
jgi:hypothetical protein